MSNNVSNLYNIMENQEIQSSSNASSASQSFRSNSLSKSNETDSSQSSPNFMQNLSDDQKRQAKNFTKRIKNQTNCKQFNKTTKKTKKCVVKKAIKKNAKLHMKNTKSDILEVSGSTSASNATPKVAQRVCQYLPLETEELQFLREEDLFNSTQNQINSFFLDGTLKKYKTDEVNINFFLNFIIFCFSLGKIHSKRVFNLASDHATHESENGGLDHRSFS